MLDFLGPKVQPSVGTPFAVIHFWRSSFQSTVNPKKEMDHV
jgi:hypothetical protein